jgi:hypothetical protein
MMVPGFHNYLPLGVRKWNKRFGKREGRRSFIGCFLAGGGRMADGHPFIVQRQHLDQNAFNRANPFACRADALK